MEHYFHADMDNSPAEDASDTESDIGSDTESDNGVFSKDNSNN